MRLSIKVYGLELAPDRSMSYDADERDFAYVEHVLGLRKQDDAVALVRHNAMGLSCLGHLATDTSRVVLSAEEAAELLRVVPSSEWSSGPLVNLYPRLTGKTP